MEETVKGHGYMLKNFENKESFQSIQFIHKVPKTVDELESGDEVIIAGIKGKLFKNSGNLFVHMEHLENDIIFEKAKSSVDKVITLKTVSDGTTNEEVLEMLITRMKYLQEAFPCRENAIVITKLEESLMWMEKRTSDRVKRNVEGK